MDIDEELQTILDAVLELLDDNSVPKSVKSKLESIQTILQAQGELSMKINRALDELDELAEDTNLQPYTRTQIWNLVSLLESV